MLAFFPVIVGQEESAVGNGKVLAILDTFGPTFAFSLDLWLPKFSFGYNGGLLNIDGSGPYLNYQAGAFGIGVTSGGMGYRPGIAYNYPVQEWFNVFMTIYKEWV